MLVMGIRVYYGWHWHLSGSRLSINITHMYFLGIVITLLVGFVIGMLAMMHIIGKEKE